MIVAVIAVIESKIRNPIDDRAGAAHELTFLALVDRLIAAHRAIVPHEVEQVGHLLEVRWDIWIVAPQMHVVELDVHDMPDPVVGGLQAARSQSSRGSSGQ
jgi:hypothetical protein